MDTILKILAALAAIPYAAKGLGLLILIIIFITAAIIK